MTTCSRRAVTTASLLAVCVSAALAGCGTQSTGPQETAATRPAVTASAADRVALPVLSTVHLTNDGKVITPAAGVDGDLVARAGCVLIVPAGSGSVESGFVIVWPPGYYATPDGNNLVIMSDKNVRIAATGERVGIGGGLASAGFPDIDASQPCLGANRSWFQNPSGFVKRLN